MNFAHTMRFEDSGFLFASQLLINAAVRIECAANVGPLYLFLDQYNTYESRRPGGRDNDAAEFKAAAEAMLTDAEKKLKHAESRNKKADAALQTAEAHEKAYAERLEELGLKAA